MKRYEDDCVGCEWCAGCGRDHTPHYYCDNCETEFDFDGKVYLYEGQALCRGCFEAAVGVDLSDMDEDEIDALHDEYDFEVIDACDYDPDDEEE